MLLLRIEVELKSGLELPLPPPPGSSARLRCGRAEIRVPFQLSEIRGRTKLGNPRVSDVLLWVPWCRLGQVASVLVNATRSDLHTLCDHVVGVSFLSNFTWGAREWNPVYRILTRNEPPPSAEPAT